jgi:hypothetical protein
MSDQSVIAGPFSPKPKESRHSRHYSRDGGSTANHEVHNTIHEMGSG